MYEYERSYKTGRAVTSWLELVGWVIVVLGVIVALAGFATGGFMGMASRNFGGPDIAIFFRIVSMVPGVLVAAGGLMSIMLAQHTKATMDTSEMTRELLAIARGETQGSLSSPTERTVEGNNISSGRDAMPEKNYRGEHYAYHLGRRISREDGIYFVDGNEFSTADGARKHIEDA